MCLNFLPEIFQLDEEDFQEEQNSVARLIQMLHNDDPEKMLEVIRSLSHIMCVYSVYSIYYRCNFYFYFLQELLL